MFFMLVVLLVFLIVTVFLEGVGVCTSATLDSRL